MKMIGLQTIRKKKGFSQLKVAMDLSISREALSYYENGKRTANVGLVLVNGEYYYVGSGAIVATSTTMWVDKTNDLLPAGNYTFGADGQMII